MKVGRFVSVLQLPSSVSKLQARILVGEHVKTSLIADASHVYACLTCCLHGSHTRTHAAPHGAQFVKKEDIKKGFEQQDASRE